MRSVVITGASTGIGWASAKLLLGRGLSRVRQRAQAGRCRPPEARVRRELHPAVVRRHRRGRGAGGRTRGARRARTAKRWPVSSTMPASRSPVPCSNLPADEFRRQMDVNVIGPIIATQAFGPLLGADPSLKGPKGRIVMISSVAGQERQSAVGGLFGLQTCDRGAVGKPAPRNDAVRDRRHHRRARRGEDADLGQGRGGRHLRLQEFALSFRRLQKVRAFMLQSRRDRTAGGDDRRKRARGADDGAAQGALSDHAGPDAASDDRVPAQAHRRQDHRQAAWPDAVG